MLFHFFQKNTTITDTYILDTKRNIKLYPRKSNNLVTTSVNTQFHVAKELVDYTLGFTIEVDVYYNPATHDLTKYNGVNGRGNNTGFHTGMFMPGVLDVNNFFGFWRNNASLSIISKTGLTADWYRYSMIVTSTTVQIKLLNLRTNVELSGNVAAVGTVDNGDTYNYTFGCYGITGSTGAYGSVGVNMSNIKIKRGSATLLHVPLSEGNLAIVRDVVSKTAYTLGFFSISAGWAKLADFGHYNFKNGFTLYTKPANANIYVPNDSTGAEIPWTPLLSYVRSANYKGTSRTFNQCESKFKLDDVTVATVLRCATAGTADAIGDYVYNSATSRWVNTVTGAYIYLQSGTEWYWKDGAKILLYYGYASTSPANVVTWFRSGGAAPAPGQLQSVLITSDLYNADPGHVLFTEGTGVAKEISIGSMYSEIVDNGKDLGHLYINSNSDKNFMLYKTDKGVDTPADLKIWKYVEKE